MVICLLKIYKKQTYHQQELKTINSIAKYFRGFSDALLVDEGICYEDMQQVQKLFLEKNVMDFVADALTIKMIYQNNFDKYNNKERRYMNDGYIILTKKELQRFLNNFKG